MSAIYDNWERLVAAVLKKHQLWILFHQQSRSPSNRSFSDLDSQFSAGSSKWHKPQPNLVLLSDFSPPFDVKDVSRAFSELLGRGTFGSTYTAIIDEGARIVVKKLQSETVSEADFKRYMEIVGGVRHENVVGLKAYYSSQDQRLMMYDYYAKGSVYSLLHGKKYKNRVNVEWETRLKIAVGAARGIAAIHKEQGGALVHGNIKASNIFLDHQSYGCVSDLGLASMINTAFDSTAHCYAPQVNNTRNISHASDVYGFGILLLELLTRRSSVSVPGAAAAVNLVKLVNSAKSKDMAAAKVFDADLLKRQSINQEMVKVLQIGLKCVAKSTKKRPSMCDVVKMLEDIMITWKPQVTPLVITPKNRHTLVFFEDARPIFDLEDLLKASAEVLGIGAFGTSYLARLRNGNTVVVERLKDVVITRQEFQHLMEVLGRMVHRNVAKLRAYYYSREEKFLVYDYYDQGNLYTMLHGKTNVDLNWGARLNIAVGTARGIAHIHGEVGQKVVHGNVKSSNILINGRTYGIISDIGLTKLIDPTCLAKVLSRGYRAPEIKITGKVSQASDIYSFGVVLLELVCGKQSQHFSTNLVKWVQAIVTDNVGIVEIFDMRCLRYDTEEAMKRVFQIALDCVNDGPEQRPTMARVVQMSEEINGVELIQGSSDWGQLPLDEKLEYLLEDLLPTLTL